MLQNQNITAIIVAAGAGTRMGAQEKNKVYLELCGKPVLARTITAFQEHPEIAEIVVAVRVEELEYCRAEIVTKYRFDKVVKLVIGGAERQDTVAIALDAVSKSCEIVLIHDGARPMIQSETITKVIATAKIHGAAAVGVPVKDTIKIVQDGRIKETPDRDTLWAIQTPQACAIAFLQEGLAEAKRKGFYGTDEAVLLEKIGKKVFIVEGKYDNIKLTTSEDLELAELFFRRREDQKGRNLPMKVGIGYDVHQLVEGKRLILGGVLIPYEKGLSGHSDADVLTHAIMDALLGATGKGDIGIHFPATDQKLKDISSIVLLERVKEKIALEHVQINNIDATIIAQSPQLSPYVEEMRQVIARCLELDPQCVNIKATTTEGLGFTGRGEGIAAQAICTVEKR